MYRTLILILSLLLTLLPVSAQEYGMPRHITSGNGLSNDFVLNLALDGQGYVWASTEAGVNRIAGLTCQSFQLNHNATRPIITAIFYHAPTDKMLIGTEDGLGIYKCDTGDMTFLTATNGLIDYSINCIAAAADGGTWLIYGNGRVQHFDCGTCQADTLQIDHYRGSRCAWDDGQGHLYLGHGQQGMSIVSLANGHTTHYLYKEGTTNTLPGNNVRHIMQDSGGRIWVGTDRGLARFYPATGTFEKVVHQSDQNDDNVYHICEMQDGTLWIATEMGGIRVVDLRQIAEGGTLYNNPANIKTSSINTHCVLQDEFGNVWVGNHSTGIDFFGKQKMPFQMLSVGADAGQAKPVYAMSLSHDDIWVGAQDELLCRRANGHLDRWTIRSSMRREHSFPRCLMPDQKGNVWLGMEDEGVVRFSPADGRFERIDIGHEASDIHAFLEDADGRIWIGSEFGVYTYADGKAKSEDSINKLTRHAPVTSFIRLPGGQLLLTTLGTGIYVVDPLRHTHVSLRKADGLPSDKINQAITDRNGGVWLATHEGLVYVADPVHLQGMTLYNQQQGLTDNHIRAMLQDARGRIWLSTYSGIACLDLAHGHFYNYTRQNALWWGGFASGAAITDREGIMYFASAAGVCMFDPMELDNSKQVSQVQFVACKVQSVAPNDEGGELAMPIGQGRIQLKHHQNTLQLTFTLRDYAQTGREEYSYMMKGLSDKWFFIGSEQNVVFRELPPGHYEFVVRAKLQEQDWDDATQTSIAINIAPPLWRTWWAYLLYFLALTGLLGYLVWSYKRKLTMRNTLQLEKLEMQQNQELNEERLRFFTNITHELRTPLTLILGPLEDLSQDNTLPIPCQRKVSMIHKNAEQLRQLINEILEFRKTETQNRRLTVARGDLGAYVHELCINYQELYRSPNVVLSHDIQPDLPPVYFDSEVITTILNNFVSNAIKYTERGSIRVQVERGTDGWLCISVSDTGYGISASVLPHIFDRYYQAKGRHQASGTGIGLALVKSLADLHEAHLSVESTEGVGSRFTFALNPGNTYPAALHKEDEEGAFEPTGTPGAEEGEEMTETADRQPVMLIVEDNADIRQYIADSFADDFGILTAANGLEGVQLAREQVPDIIVSDIMMPHMDGIELTRRLKADLSTSHIPIILLTAKDTDADKEEGYQWGADSYLTKPFSAKLLSTRVNNLLAARRRMAEYIMSTQTGIPAVNKTEAEPTGASACPALSRLDREFLERLNAVIEENIMTQDLDMPFMTDKMAMSHSTFYRKVKALTGLTAKEYIRKIKLRHCYKLLESGDYNVTEAAMMTGFNQMAHFRDIFRKEFGMTPSDVRRHRN